MIRFEEIEKMMEYDLSPGKVSILYVGTRKYEICVSLKYPFEPGDFRRLKPKRKQNSTDPLEIIKNPSEHADTTLTYEYSRFRWDNSLSRLKMIPDLIKGVGSVGFI